MVRAATSVEDSRTRLPDSEKITVNLGPVDLGHIDLLVREGFYGNRTDLIRTAIRREIERHETTLRTSVDRQALDLGLRRYGRAELEQVRAAGGTLRIQVLGLVVIGDDVDPELARDTIASLRVLGALQAPAAVKAALRDRIA
ncbi:CopG family transcriptional regulator [Lichenihabitans sp. Uapishka_5]|uniref:CopG family transcriptional regulator n=1 Tax=Lichenihabitans sp. Uapishka_5 TaxID=3037302 RepID=UPI0029E8163F|nr:CopG family transcriptional regulator [Lichenihabitans sp. Uapishka_5]MDX7952932.1 CopG family transcriptional regulator [Lichenihabitans sp. Uapishka_5]